MRTAVTLGLICCCAVCCAQPDTLWTRVLGDSVGTSLGSIDCAPNGDVIIATHRVAPDPEQSWLARVDPSGNVVWLRHYAGVRILDVRALSSNNLVALASGSIRILTGDGDSLDTHSDESPFQYLLIRGAHNNFYTGFRTSYVYWRNGSPHGVMGIFPIEADSMGMPGNQWTGGSENCEGETLLQDVQEGPGGSYTAVGPHECDYYYLRARHTEQGHWWNHEFSWNGGNGWLVESAIERLPSEVTVIAADVTFEGTDSVHLYFLQDDGTLLRTADVQSPFSFHLADMKAVPDGCVLLGTAHYGGDAGTDIAIIKLDASGYQEWTTTFGGDGSESASELVIHSDGACTILGSIVPAGGSTQSPYLLRTGSVLTSVGKNRGLSPRFSLSPAFPNPFNPSTEIRFEVGRTEQVKLTVFDLLGREVAVLADETMSAGSYARTFDGHGLASGMYLYRLEAGEEVQTRKMVLLK